MNLGTASVIAGAAVALGVLALVAYMVKKLGGNAKTALLIGAIIIALSTLLTQLPPIIEAFRAPLSVPQMTVAPDAVSSANVVVVFR